MSLIKDRQFGWENETEILEKLQTYFKDPSIRKTPNQFDEIDFEGENISIELKTRRNLSTLYPTTMIGINKIRYARKNKNTTYFVFKFTDCTKRIRFRNKLFKTFDREWKTRYDRGYPERGLYVMIPMYLLKLIK